MKLFPLVFFLFYSLFAFSADEIVLKDGSKLTLKTNSFKVNFSENSITYQTLSSSKEQSLSFKDFDYVIAGVNKFQTFNLEGSSSVEGYFVLAESNSKKLIFRSIYNPDGSIARFIFHILNENLQILDSHFFDAGSSKKSVDVRAEIYLKIRHYFSTCTEMMKRLEVYDMNAAESNHVRILLFFKSPMYYKCN
ncbi:hypothetical protein [Flavobacterium luminosum]|uniref:DUF4369 domain-containing protein n=1 Tax=Flavobacterium luminosum TaxID=2949086 RepID=A0ABT0TR49_9FLAO|nr:hypothetical protein [Flavobacterium sp. HXWNR70]MCL9809957.1 hypothetical protein [Flavobacterium sp. HXWNR70]